MGRLAPPTEIEVEGSEVSEAGNRERAGEGREAMEEEYGGVEGVWVQSLGFPQHPVHYLRRNKGVGKGWFSLILSLVVGAYYWSDLFPLFFPMSKMVPEEDGEATMS